MTAALPRLLPVDRQALSVAAATGAYGLSCGALCSAAGLSLLQTQALSALLFSGGSQFAIAGLLGAGGSGVAALTASSLLGVRNGLYAVQLGRLLAPRGWRRLVAAQLTIDESAAVAAGQDDPALARRGFWVTGVAVFVLWNLMTFLGALLGNALGDPKAWGLDAAGAAAFCGLLWPRLHSTEGRLTAGLAVVLALVAAPYVPAGAPIVLAAAAAFVVGASRVREPAP